MMMIIIILKTVIIDNSNIPSNAPTAKIAGRDG